MENAKQFQLPLGGKRFPLSLENAHLLIVRAIEHGSIFPLDSFKERCTVIGTLDAERVIKSGTISEPMHFVDEKWVFNVVGVHQARLLEIKIVLDLAEDLACPEVYFMDMHARRLQ